MRLAVIAGGLAALVAAAGAAQEPAALDYPALLRRVVDGDWLWSPPRAGERCVQWSSFDRASQKGPADPFAWYGNDDRGNYLRIEERDGAKEFVLVDAEGPGCVARIWSANPSGTLHFDVDGARVWSVDFAALCGGKIDGVPEPLAGMRGRGGNCHLPIPFVKSLKVSATAGDLYYHVDVARLDVARSFAPGLLAAHGAAIDALCRGLPTAIPPFRTLVFAPSARAEIPARTVVQNFRVTLPAALERSRQLEIVRECELVVRCGAEETVRVPLADFFAAGSAWREHRTRFLAVAGAAGYCAFPMPMPDGGSIAVEAPSLPDCPYLPHVLVTDRAPLEATAPLLFRAGYHLVKGTPARPFSDHLVLDAKGPGRFVGCSLLVRNPSRMWWGEGDEKFTVDGEQFPSWFGTGTEDYFGYAWCSSELFQAPLHAQIECQGPVNFGFTQLFRAQVLDSVPFASSFRFDLERWHWVETATVDYATVAYWYGAPGATSGLPPLPPAAERRLVALTAPPLWVAEHALEGEALGVVSCSGGTHTVQDTGVFERMFSGDGVRTWHSGRPGDVLVLAVPVAAAGRYRVTAAFGQNVDAGIVQCALSGQRLGDPFDGYHDRVRSTGPRLLGEVRLEGGVAELRLELLGRNQAAQPVHMVALDYLRLEAIE